MRLHRFYITSNNLPGEPKKKPLKLADLGVSSKITLDSAQGENNSSLIHQWKDVFRYMVGSRVVLFDDSKVECLCIIDSLSEAKADLIILEITKGASKAKGSGKGSPSPIGSLGEVWLFASIVKNDNFEVIIQKTTELGVDHIVPVISDRTIKTNINMKRAEKIAVEASEQSGRLTVPKVHEPIPMKKALENFLAQGGDVVVCLQDGTNWLKAKALLKKYPLGLLVGPEGGWSEKELAYFEASGFKKIKIGENVLRAETAAISMITLVKIG